MGDRNHLSGDKMRFLGLKEPQVAVALGWLGAIICAIAAPSLAAKTEVVDPLEQSVWNATDDRLDEAERLVVRRIQEKSDIMAKLYYLNSRIFLRRYALNPANFELIKKAQDLADDAILLDPKEEYGYVASASVLQLMGRDADAKALVDRFKDKINASWRFAFVSIQLTAGETSVIDTIGKLERIVDAHVDSREIVIPYVLTAIVKFYTPDEALALLERLNKKWSSSLITMEEASLLASQGRYKLALETYLSIKPAAEEYAEAQINAGIIEYHFLGRVAGARTRLNKLASQRMPLGIRESELLGIHRSVLLLEAGAIEESSKALVPVLKGSETPATILQYVSESFQGKRYKQNHVKLLDLVNEAIPGRSEFYRLQGIILSSYLAQQGPALAALGNAIILDPENADNYTEAGLIFHHVGDLEDALASFEAALIRSPSDAVATYNKACILALMGKSQSAIATLSIAVGLDPGLKQKAQTDSDFRTIVQMPRFREITAEDTILKE